MDLMFCTQWCAVLLGHRINYYYIHITIQHVITEFRITDRFQQILAFHLAVHR